MLPHFPKVIAPLDVGKCLAMFGSGRQILFIRYQVM